MNKFAKAAILGTAAIATFATTFEAATAADWRHRGFHGNAWRHNGHNFHDRAVAAGVIGLAAGVVVGGILAQPRVVYRDRADVVVEDGPVYASPDDEVLGPDDDSYADDPDYAAPRQHRMTRVEPDDGYNQGSGDDRDLDDQSMNYPDSDDGYFPQQPQRHARTERRSDVAAGALEPWTAQWRSYCRQRYSSFNATTGTYMGYDGNSHFCTSG